MISAKGQTGDGQFGASGASLPAEMLPDSIVSGGVVFRLGPKEAGKANALACKGQTFSIPSGDFNRLYLLAASAGDEQTARFIVDAKPVTLSVGAWSGFVGQWDNRIWDGFVWKESDYSWDTILYEGLKPGYSQERDHRLSHDSPAPRERGRRSVRPHVPVQGGDRASTRSEGR